MNSAPSFTAFVLMCTADAADDKSSTVLLLQTRKLNYDGFYAQKCRRPNYYAAISPQAFRSGLVADRFRIFRYFFSIRSPF